MSVGKKALIWKSTTGGVVGVAAPGVACTIQPVQISSVDFNDLAFNPDGTRLAVAVASSQGVILYNTVTWSSLSVAAVGAVVSRCAWSPDGQYLALGMNSSPYLRIYHVPTWSVVPGTPTMPGPVNSLKWSPDGQYIAFGTSTSPYLRVIKTIDWTLLSGLTTFPALDVAWSPDGTYLAAVSTTSPYRKVWQVSTWSEVSVVATFAGAGCAFSSDSAHLFVSAQGSPNRLLKISVGTWSISQSLSTAGAPSRISITSDCVAVVLNQSPYLIAVDPVTLGSIVLTGSISAAANVCALSPQPMLKSVAGHVQTEAGVDAGSIQVRLLERTGETVSSATTAGDGKYTLLALREQRYTRIILDSRAGASRDVIDQPTPRVTTLLDAEHYLWPTGTPVSVSGNVTTTAGAEADQVAVVRWANKELVTLIEPDEDGDWTAELLPGNYGIAYFAAGCQPVLHGPYIVAVP